MPSLEVEEYWSRIHITSCDAAANLSAIIPKTCSNFVCLSSAVANDPLLPHKNLI